MMATTPNLFGLPPVAVFSGADYDAERDAARLTRQVDRIRDVSLRSGWTTVQKIAIACRKQWPDAHFPENSVQAQLRNLKKLGYRLERRNVADRGYLCEYLLLTPEVLGA